MNCNAQLHEYRDKYLLATAFQTLNSFRSAFSYTGENVYKQNQVHEHIRASIYLSISLHKITKHHVTEYREQKIILKQSTNRA